MARPLRIQYRGAVYNVTCRGNERKEIFRDDKDRQAFLEILVHSLKTYNINLCSYVLMNNRFHLLIETPLGNLGEFMRHFNISYTGYFNRRHNRAGHLYQGRYKSLVVDRNEYLSSLSRYIHLNPVPIKTLRQKSEKEKIEDIAIEEETGKSMKEMKEQGGSLRQLTMDVLYRIGGLKRSRDRQDI